MVLRERVWVIVACTILCLLASIAYVEVAAKSYQAESQLLVQPTSPNDAVESELPILHSTGDPTDDVLTGAGLVTTEPVAAAVVRALHLKTTPTDLLGDVAAAPIGQSNIVAVLANAPTPAQAAALANAFVAQAIAGTTDRMHAYIRAELPLLITQADGEPISERDQPGGVTQTVDEYEVLLHQSDPTLTLQAPAPLPTAPASPKKMETVLAGLVGGLLLGIGAAFLLHALDPRLRREEQLRDRFGLPILARIPRQRHPRPRPLLPSELTIGAHEGYRTLRTTLAARASTSEPRAFLVTGAAPSEGKSTTAIGLAAALAQGGGRVILIEADLRKPTFASSFNLVEFNGVERVLLGKVPLAKAMVPVRVDGVPLRVLAAHSSAADVSGGLSFAVVRKLISDAKALADFVVIDSAPLTEVIDALPFAQAADEVLIVARLEQTRLNKLDELDDLLSQHGVTQMGVVLIGDHAARGAGYYHPEATNGGSRPGSSRRGGIDPERSSRGLFPG
jgi:capsular exopolysaccharide synthesis family protein